MVDVDMLRRHDEAFCHLMELIPAEVYFPKTEEEQEASWLGRYAKNTKGKAPKQEIKDKSKKGKRMRYDPQCQKTNAEIQSEKALVAAENRKRMREEQSALKAADSDSEDDEGCAMVARGMTDSKTEEDPQGTSTTTTTESEDIAPSQADSAIEGLRERLQKRIQELKKKRKASPSLGKLDKPNKRQRRGKGQKNPVKKHEAAGKEEGKAKVSGSDAGTPQSGQAAQADNPVNVIDANDIKFSGVRIEGAGKAGKGVGKKGKGVSGLKKLLQKAEENQKKVEELKKSEEGKAVVDAQNWKKAMKLAKGEKILDDTKLIKQSLKKKEKKKQKSAKEWRNRSKENAEAKKLGKKAQQIRDEKKKNAKAKGPSNGAKRPGFEGRKGGEFLNKSKN